MIFITTEKRRKWAYDADAWGIREIFYFCWRNFFWYREPYGRLYTFVESHMGLDFADE